MVFENNYKLAFKNKCLNYVIFYLQPKTNTYYTHSQFNCTVLIIRWKLTTNDQNVPNVNQCTYGHFWSWTVAPFKNPGMVVNGLTDIQNASVKRSSFSVIAKNSGVSKCPHRQKYWSSFKCPHRQKSKGFSTEKIKCSQKHNFFYLFWWRNSLPHFVQNSISDTPSRGTERQNKWQRQIRRCMFSQFAEFDQKTYFTTSGGIYQIQSNKYWKLWLYVCTLVLITWHENRV